MVDLSWDYARREKCGRIVEIKFGLAPVPSKHARAVERALRREGRSDVADRLVASGSTEAKRPVARLTPRERLIEERTGVALDDLRRLTLAAWRETADGPGFLAALRARGLELRLGRAGPVVIDASGTVHPVTRLVGAAARRFEGTRIRAAMVKERLAGLRLEGVDDGHVQVSRRLAAMEVLRPGILAALAPPESEGVGFDDLVEALSDLTVAVADMADMVREAHAS